MKSRISLAIFLLLMHLCSWAQIGGDYNPTNPSDPGNPTQEYTLTLKATPTNGGSFNTTSTNIAGGKTYNLRAYPNTDFAFVAWLCNGDTLSKSSSYTYTMPYHDVEIIGVFTYSPSSPSDPNVIAQKYTLTLKATPSDGGSFNTTSAKVSVGERYNLRAYPNTDFTFVAWLCEGDTLSKLASYDYTMPSHNVDITGVFTYRPSSPSDPQEQALKYQLSLTAVPMNSGSFNISNERLAVGSNNSLRAYSNTDFVFRRWTMGDSVLSTNPNMDFVMPSHNVQIVGHFEYNPASPANPNANYWNKLTGEVIVDDFTAGYLSSAISTVISGSSSNDVQMITVSGRINSNDFGVANNYKNCSLLDLSRVTGVTEVPSYAFDYTNLETVYLPSSIEKIGARAFADCSKLSSITVYAMTPPTLESGVFQGVPDGIVVHVPAAAIAQYQDDEAWGKFTLLPIQEDIRSISISLPEGTNAQDYAQMWLELTNTKSGQRMHYVMTDRQTYTFANIIRNTSWNVTLRNERGDVFGQIENVEVKDEDVTVTFASLSKPQNVSLSVLTPDGNDVTNQVQVTWTDAQGNYVAQGASLSGLPIGYQVNYRMALSQELAMQFDTPATVEYTLKDGGNALTCQLQAIKKLTISGKVKDATTGLPLSGTVISASQTFGGKYSKTLNAKTDGNGVFTMEVFNVPTSVAIAATDYVSQTIDYSNNEFNGLNEFAIPDVSLKSITGVTISVGFTYTTVEGETQNWYSDYQNVSYTLYNTTREKSISQFNVQYPQIVLLEEVEDGDVLRLTATSRTNAFKAVEATATIAEQRGEAMFAITELGRIEASFSKTGNASVVGSLYDASGKLVKTYNYSEAKLTINDLADGNYTLVSMGSSRLFNTIYDLAQLPQTGLTEGTDYVQNTVEVKSGAVSMISIVEVPTLDESKLYYTSDNTSFTVNKPSIVAGNYLTLTGRIDFKPAYAASVSNVQMIVDLPESCEFVENSVMVGNSTSSYTLNGNRITIPMARYTDRVRFCIIPTLRGEYAPSAFVQFDLDGETVTQPIGSASYTVQNLSISVPPMTAEKAISIHGAASGRSNVYIYDNNVLIGQTIAYANGTWNIKCNLNDSYSLSYHNINAKVVTAKGLELTSDTKKCLYDSCFVQISNVHMLYNGNDLVFDFLNPSANSVYYSFVPSRPEFTFTVNFTDNDTTKVTNVVLYVKTSNNLWIPIECSYDNKHKCWIANERFSSSNLPINVSLDYDVLSYGPVSRQSLTNAEFDYLGLTNKQETIESQYADFMTLFESGNLANDDFESLFNELVPILPSGKGSVLEGLDLNALLALAQQRLSISEEYINDSINEAFSSLTQYNKFDLQEYGIDGTLEIRSTDGLDIGQLLNRGFEKIAVDDNTEMYQLVTELSYEIVDFKKQTYSILLFNSDSESSRRLAASNGGIQSLINKVNQFNEKFSQLSGLIGLINEAIGLIPSFFDNKISKIALAIEENRSAYKALQYFEGMAPTLEENLEISEQIKRLKAENIKLGKERAKLLANQEGVMKAIEKVTAVIGAFLDAYSMGSNASAYINLWYEVPFCACDVSKTEQLQGEILNAGLRCAGKDLANIIGDLVTVHMIFGATTAAPATGGTSLILGVAGISLSVVKGLVNHWADKEFEKERAMFSNRISLLAKDKSCNNCPDPEPEPSNPSDPPKPNNPDPKGDGGNHKSGNPDGKPSVDPSGYVYEGVSSNRIEGVTATAFYKEMVEDMYGDLYENIVKWDAAEYGQENPLFTDENGMYAWDVPQGLWQVKFEKDGYETTYSEWLPVPPPQLDVNIAMKQNVQPTVKNARAYEDAVEVEFDKYMMPELLTTENIIVMQNGIAVDGTVELLNEEVSYEGEADTFASKIRFNAAQSFTEQEITLMVSNRVKSYAGIRMQDNYQQTFTIEQEIKQIAADSVITVGYGNASTLTVSVLPASASKGKTLTVKTSSPMILSVETEQVTIGNDGKAEIAVNGELPGTAALTFSVEGTDKTAMTIANVEQIVIKTVATPKASIASGTVVEKGTAITLTCETEGATIYYTLDGSCPCDNTDARKIYDGTPIIINETTIIKAMAVAPDMYESDVVEFAYIVEGTGIDDVTVNDQIQIYPLPVHDKVNISVGGKAIKSVTISSMNGVVVASANKPATTVTLDVSRIPTGIYIINVTTVDSTFSRKILKVE